jgi:hypothetical protein
VKSSDLALTHSYGLRYGRGGCLTIRRVDRGVLLDGASCHHRRNGMLENQLLLVTRFEHKRILVEALDPAGEFNTAQEIDRDQSFFLARIIQKAVLDVLRWLIHLCIPGPEKVWDCGQGRMHCNAGAM